MTTDDGGVFGLHRTEDYVDAFFTTVEMVSEMQADKGLMEHMYGGKKLDKAPLNMEAYKQRRAVRKQVREKFVGFHIDFDHLSFEGAQKNANGDWVVVGNELKLYDDRDVSGRGLVFTGPAAQCAMNLIAFYLDSYEKGINPRGYVKRVLAEQGVTKDNFHKFRDRLLISDPWEDER